MRWIKIPSDIVYRDELTGEVIKFDNREATTFYEWFVTVVLRDATFGKGLEAFDHRAELLDAVKNYRPGGPNDNETRVIRAFDVVGLPTAAWERCKNALREPSPPWHAIAGAAFRPFVKALMEAKEKPEDLT